MSPEHASCTGEYVFQLLRLSKCFQAKEAGHLEHPGIIAGVFGRWLRAGRVKSAHIETILLNYHTLLITVITGSAQNRTIVKPFISGTYYHT